MTTRRYKISPEHVQKARSRRITNDRFVEIIHRLLNIDRSFQQLKENQDELYRHYPIALFACLETWTRMAVCEIVDYGEPFRSNALDLMSDKKIDFDTMMKLNKDTFTLGEFVSSSQQVSQLSHIFHIMDKLLKAGKFRDNIGEARNCWEDLESEPIISDIEQTCGWLEEMIELRHIYCHETALGKDVGKAEIEQYIRHTQLFIHASNRVLDYTIYLDSPIIQAEAKTVACRMVSESRESLNGIIDELSKILTDHQKPLLAEASRAWERFLSASVKTEGLVYEEGTVRECMEAIAARKLIDQRIQQLTALRDITML